MAAQTTEVCEKNGMNLEATTSTGVETTIQTATETTAATATAALAMNKDHYDDVDVQYDTFANEKADMKVECILPSNIDAQGITNTTNTNTSNIDTDVNSSAMSINEKRNVQIEELQSDPEDVNTSCSGEDGYGEGGGLATTTSALGNDIGSNPNLSGDHDNTIPEWKKELLQRRRTKIARTIGANQISSVCTKKDLKSTSPVVPLTKTLATSNSNNTNKNSSHQITSNKLLPTVIPSTTSVTTNTHQMTVTGANQTQLDCSTTGHYTTVNSLQSCVHQPQQICGIGNSTLLTNTSLEIKSTSSFSSQSSSAIITTPSNPTLKNSEFNNCSNSSSDSNNQSFTISVESGLKCGSNNNNNNSDISNNTSTSSCSSSSSSSSSSNNNFSGTCRVTSQSKQQQNQLEQTDSVLVNTSSSQERQEQLQQPFQLHSRHENVKTLLPSTSLSSCSVASPPTITAPLTVTSNCNTNNNSTSSFVKNPSVGKASLNKASKYKLSAKLNSLSSNGSVVTSSQTKKMVAMQQMEVNDTSVAIDLDFDPSEELQYGPGIVSKLRCRYLSLALRQSAGKQRPPLDNLRRATSLNNLLDDDDDSNNGSVIDHVDHIENNTKNIVNNSSSSVTTPDEFVANFQKNLKISEKDKQRSRQLKRGNDSLKRARSVEALLSCDKSWDHVNNTVNNGCIDKTPPLTRQQLYHHRLEGTNNVNVYDHSSINSAAEVTIEDKIIHAKERILCEKTPKRLTSIIDDTERPPPDVVKQTLKIFEATANRRGRGLSRNNYSGEVAAKVATYKSIISQEKPPIVFPKPPLSPKRQFKKPGSLDIAPAKRNTTTNNSTNIQTKKINPTSPISNLAKKFTNLDAFSDSCEKNSLIQTSNQGTTSPSPSASGGHRAEVTLRHRHNFMTKNESTPIRNSFDSNSNSPSRTPDLIPRKHFEHSLFAESLSPVTQLTKNIEKLKIESPQPTQLPVTQTNSSVNTVAGSLVTSQRQNSEPNDSSDISDVEEQIKQVSKTTVTKNSLYKNEINQENNLNKSSSSCITSSSSLSCSSNKPSLAISINGNSLTTTGSCTGGGNSIEQHQIQQGQQQQQAISIKQVCVIRPLLAETKLPQHIEKSNSSDKIDRSEKSELLSTVTSDTLNANKIRDNLVISNLSQSSTIATATTAATTCNNLINLNQSVEQQQQLLHQRPALTSREIEKNLINEKKNEQAAMEASSGGVNKWPFMKKKSSSSSSGTSSWNQQMAEAQNNSMVFNFKDRKEVPDYIENDGLLVKRRRELPKPNEPGFVLLGDLSLETSTDPDDAWTMGPPSPCDVEFENANIIIDGKSSIRYKAKDISLKVQFDDTLTSTFEYPSESSLLEESPSTFETAITTEITATTTPSTIHQHGKMNEVINKSPGQKLLGNVTLDYRNGPKSIKLQQSPPQPPLPTVTSNNLRENLITTTRHSIGGGGDNSGMKLSSSSSSSSPSLSSTKKFVLKPPNRMKPLLLFSTVPVGSAPLGSYTPIKAQINTTFELGITRAPTTITTRITNDGCAIQNINTTNGNTICENNDLKNKMNNTLPSGSLSSSCVQQNGDNSILSSSSSSTTNKNNEFINNEPESLPYLKPATDDHTVIYSEGSQKTDLLY